MSGNILLTPEGDCKLANFAISQELTALPKRVTVIGIPYWMAPEVLQSKEYDGKADIWSLAITAIELAVGEPPHSNMHPMRAIFMIFTSEPPTLPDPSKWSKDFNDFLKVCLVKVPENRPTARWLLDNHPFITKAKGKEVMAALVKERIKEIDAFRDQEAASDNDGDATFGAGTGDIKTLVVGGTGGTGTVSGTIERKVETQVLKEHTNDGGTIVQKSQREEPGSETAHFSDPVVSYHQGTMVYHSGNMELNGGGTLKNKQDSTSSDSESLDVDPISSLFDRCMSLISSNQAFEDEMTALEQFYSKRRQHLTDMIAQKEGEALQCT